MARRVYPPPQPSLATTPDQALVIPTAANMPEVLLAVQQSQSANALHAEIAQLHQDVGALTARVDTFDTNLAACVAKNAEVKTTHDRIAGGLKLLGIICAALLTALAFMFSSKIRTLDTIIEERQIQDMHKQDAPEPTQGKRARESQPAP
jgi:L-serine deaminase